MKIMTILGTRPEIIRLCLVIAKLDRLCHHVLVHTGQNFDPGLSDIFFEQLNVRKPDHFLGVRGTGFGEQIGQIIAQAEKVLLDEKPDRLLLLGDTNSALTAIVAKRMGIPVYHMEAGNRCYDDRVPEEVNRRIIDHSSDVLMPYTERSRANLLREGISGDRILVTGNPIKEVIRHFGRQIESSRILDDLDLASGQYVLVTMHRAENVDIENRLKGLAAGLDLVQRNYGIPVIVSTHPRTRSRLETFGIVARQSPSSVSPSLWFF
jgi:UDP-N-acetylglucosamine 2-epimerase (non-hydrolysing)